MARGASGLGHPRYFSQLFPAFVRLLSDCARRQRCLGSLRFHGVADHCSGICSYGAGRGSIEDYDCCRPRHPWCDSSLTERTLRSEGAGNRSSCGRNQPSILFRYGCASWLFLPARCAEFRISVALDLSRGTPVRCRHRHAGRNTWRTAGYVASLFIAIFVLFFRQGPLKARSLIVALAITIIAVCSASLFDTARFGRSRQSLPKRGLEARLVTRVPISGWPSIKEAWAPFWPRQSMVTAGGAASRLQFPTCRKWAARRWRTTITRISTTKSSVSALRPASSGLSPT
jgi:hypothetical protein